MKDLNRELSNYSIALTTFESTHQLPSFILQEPDHLAIGTADIKEFAHAVKSLNDNVEQMVCVEDTEGRFRVSAKMLGSVSLGIYGRVKWLEVIESEQSGIDHTEFYYPDFSRLLEKLRNKDIEHGIEFVNGHKVADVPFEIRGEEFKFRVSDIPLSVLVAEEIDNGDAHVLAA